MARNGKRNGQLPAKLGGATPVVSDTRYRAGVGRPTNTFRLRAAYQLEKARGLEVLGRILSGDILEILGSDKHGELIVGQTKNTDRIGAFRELRDAAGYGSPKPVSIETTGDVKILVVYDE